MEEIRTTTRRVILCTQRFYAPADAERAKEGLEPGLVLQERLWLEVDGKAAATDRPTVGEVKVLL